MQLGVVIAEADARGYGVTFVTRTMRHNKRDSLGTMWPILSRALNDVSTKATVRKHRERLGYLATVGAAEVTWGERNGFHPHRHRLDFYEHPVTRVDVAILESLEVEAFIRAVSRRGMAAPMAAGQYLKVVTADDALAEMDRYFTKASHVTWEMASTQTKSAQDDGFGTITPWAVLAQAERNGDADMLAVWRTYERASKGKKALVIGPKARALFNIEHEVSDEEIVDTTVGERDGEQGFYITDWQPVREQPALGAGILNALQGGNWNAARRFCQSNAVPYLEFADLTSRLQPARRR